MADHLTALMEVKGKVLGSQDLYMEFIVRAPLPAQVFSSAAVGAATARLPQGNHGSWLG